MTDPTVNPSEVAREIVRVVDESGPAVPIRLGADGHVQRLGVDRRLDVTFEYRGFLFAVRAKPVGDKVSVRIHANLGYLPYTQENAENRTNALAIVHAAVEATGGRMHITPGQSIIIKEEFELEGPFELKTVLAKTVSLLVQAKPYLELLSVVIHPPAFRRPAA